MPGRVLRFWRAAASRCRADLASSLLRFLSSFDRSPRTAEASSDSLSRSRALLAMRCAPLLRPHSVPATCCSPSFRFPLANSSRSPSHPSSPVLACSLRSVTLYARACLYLATRRASWRAVACCELGSSCSRCPSSLVDLRTALLSRQDAAAHPKLASRAGSAVDRCSRRRVERRSLSAHALSHFRYLCGFFLCSCACLEARTGVRSGLRRSLSPGFRSAAPRERHAPPQLLVPSAVPCKASMHVVALL